MIMKEWSALRSVLAVFLALVFLGAGTVLAVPEAANPPADTETFAAVAATESVADMSGRAAVVDIPEGTTAIANGQFQDDKDLTLVRIPDSVKTIGDRAFYGCTNLTQIIIPDSVTTIGKNAFARSGISKADIGNGVTNIGDEAFYQCVKLRSLTLGSRVNVIGSQAFWGCTSLLQVDIPDSVTQIKGSDRTYDNYTWNGDYDSGDSSYSSNLGAFGNCTSLQRVTIGSGLTALEGHTFRGCTDLRQVTFGPNLRTIGPLAFRNTKSLEQVQFPDSLVEIEAKAFKQSGITELTAGNDLTRISEFAFQDCRNLAEVQFGESLRILGAGTFSGCVSLEEALLPESVTMLEGNGNENGGVFSGCTSLSKVTTGDGLVSIGSYAFCNCTALKTAIIGPRVQSVGASAFQNCSSLEELIIPDSAESLGSNLAMASGISKVSIGSGAGSIPENAFRDCERLTDVTIGKNVTNIEPGAFAGCQSLREIVIPDKVDIIGGQSKTGAFANCISLETVTLGLKSFPADNTFSGCWALRTIRYPGTQAQWDALGFPLPAGATLELFTPLPSTSTEPAPTKDPSPSTEPSPSAIPSTEPSPSASPSAQPSTTAKPSATARPTAVPSATVKPSPVPSAIPAPSIPAVNGYQGGLLNGRVYYTRTSGASMLFYQQRSNGSLGRVSAPYVTDGSGTRYYPINNGGTVLYPRLENGKLTAYCLYSSNRQIPVMRADAVPATGTSNLQYFMLNGRQYYARTSGASILFYQRRSSGSLGRVSAPYVTSAGGIRYYPVNCGGTVLYPKLTGGQIASYCSYSSITGDDPALTVL